MVQVGRDDQHGRGSSARRKSAQVLGEPLTLLEIAVANYDADDRGCGSQPREQRQVHFDRVFVLVGRGVQFQAGNGGGQAVCQFRDRPNLVPREGPVSCGATAHGVPSRVCFGASTITRSGISIRLNTAAAILPE